MTAKRIPQLDAIAGASTANDDNLVIFDTSADATKRILRSQLAEGLVGDLPYSGRTVVAKLGDFVSVKDYGAVGDGTTDDTAAINAAIATNKAVYFPAGTYLHTGIAITRVNNYVHLEGAGRLKTTLKCVTASVHNISISNTGGSGTYYQYPTIRGMALEGAAGTGCGIYANGVSIYSFDDLRILSAGSHGIQLTDSGTTSNGSYIGRITNCFIQGCTGSGIHQVGTSGTNQQNASWITNCEIRANAHGITCWGNNITVQNCSLEGNTGYGIRFTNEGAAYYSAYNLALKNCYMEANAAGQIYARTNSSGTYGAIVGLEIIDNFISCSNSGNAGYVAVLFDDGGGLSETRALQFRANALTFQTTPTIIANFGNSLGSDCVVAPQYTFSSSTPDYTTTATKYTGLGMAKFEFVKGLTLSGWAYAKGGSGISYSALNKSANITVTGSNTYFPLPLPLSAHVVQFAVPVETDATSYSVQFVFAGRAYNDAAASFTNRVNPTVSGLSGSQVVATSIMESYTSTGGRQVTANMDCYLQIVVTLTTPGTYFYLGNPTVFYNEA